MFKNEYTALIKVLNQIPYVLSLFSKEEWSADKKAYGTMLENTMTLVAWSDRGMLTRRAGKLIRKVIRGCVMYSEPEYKGNRERNFKIFSKQILEEAEGLKPMIEDEYARNPN